MPTSQTRIPAGRPFNTLSGPTKSRIRAKQLGRQGRLEQESNMTSTERNQLRSQKRKDAAKRATPVLQADLQLQQKPQTPYEIAKLDLERSTPTLEETLYRLHNLHLGQGQYDTEEARMKKEDKAHKQWMFRLIQKPDEQDPSYPRTWSTVHTHRIALGVLRGNETGQISIVPAIAHLIKYPFETAASEPEDDLLSDNDNPAEHTDEPANANNSISMPMDDDTVESPLLPPQKKMRRTQQHKAPKPGSTTEHSAVQLTGERGRATRAKRAAMRMKAEWEKAGYLVWSTSSGGKTRKD